MRDRDLTALELDQVRQHLSELARSPGGKQACLRLAPSPERDVAAAALLLSWECYRTIERHGELPLAEIPDVREALRRAAHEGFLLDGLSLLTIRAVLDDAQRVHAYLHRHAGDSLGLAQLGARIEPQPELRATLARCLDDDGGVTDAASEELAATRETLRRLRARLTRRLEAMLDKPHLSELLSDRFVTLRNNRFVLPVRTGSAHQVPGVVQDRSVSGETTFVEPMFAVELNNQILLAGKEEEMLVRRILADLTAMVHHAAAPLERTYAALVEADALHARALFARRYRCSQPQFDETQVDLRAARHPVLEFSGRPVVPIDLRMPPGKRVLVVTGPNTGGKTVALKTLGLLSLMAQCGIPIPVAEGSRLPCFRAIFADVGDAQSIERDLSTFSGHLANIKEILGALRPPTLVILDEPGVGTDPEEGAALGVGILRTLADAGARVVVTTHFSRIKAFALTDAACLTAAVDFDVEQMRATYRLVYDSVGESLAVPIARRLGMPETVLAAAAEARSVEARAFSAAMDELEGHRRAFERSRSAADAAIAAAQARESEASRLLDELKRKRDLRALDELRSARDLVRSVRDEGRALLQQIERGAADKRRLDEFVRRQTAALVARRDELEEPLAPTPAAGPVHIGDQVEVVGTQLRGELTAITGDRAWIQRGSLRFEVPADGLRKAGAAPQAAAQRVGSGIERSSAGSSVELSLLGMRVREALSQLDAFLDRAQLDGVERVRIIHGIGSGALRKAVLDYLDTCPYCTSHRPGGAGEGGNGATIAELGG